MDTINLQIGSETSANSGGIQSDLRPVEFIGELLAEDSWYDDPQSDTRGTKQTLYKTEYDRLVVYVEHWTRWQGETSTYTLYEANETDLQPNGKFEKLGRAAGYGRPLTLDEALKEERN